ncbi:MULTISPECIES: hypothetical protein [unclassified Paracoccus (in: a-proteobacteria)]|uniref:hypothetical protein n=1 Tax=unclassified Paracoccus (in: a-proteobacteria) TaxID=2688777 RepID=UPI0011AF86EE|nr:MULTISPECIES: hypothetical protein [unclassified Paracoccus (in: a-proteobacteria)]QIR86825.1 hypothetical protein FIU66_16125 [Paracoccus sp. AK26]
MIPAIDGRAVRRMFDDAQFLSIGQHNQPWRPRFSLAPVDICSPLGSALSGASNPAWFILCEREG